MDVQKIQEKVQGVTNLTGPTGGGITAYGAFTLNEWLTIAGFLLALGSFLINWYYQHKRYELERDRRA